MLKRILRRFGVVKATVLVSLACVVVAVLISVTAMSVVGQQDWGFILLLSVLCPSLIAPPVTYAYSRLMHELESSQTTLLRELEERVRTNDMAQELEVRFRQVLEHTTEAFCMATPDFQKFYYASSAYERIWGRSIESLYASPISFLASVDKRDRKRVLAALTAGFYDEEEEVEYRISRPDGTMRWIRTRLLSVEDSAGGNPRTVGFSEDITDRKRAEAELETQRAKSARADRLRSLGEMAAGIAHELNQPLVGVRGLAEYSLIGMDRGWQPEDTTHRDRFSKIVEQVDRMVNIIEHVRLFAREAGKPELSSVDINDVVRSSIDLLGAQMKAHGMALECELASGLPSIEANPFSLEEVLINLVSNARHSIEAKRHRDETQVGGVVRIRTCVAQAESGSRVAVTVSDDGVGIAEPVLERAFDPFYTTKPPDEGTGLGLSVSRAIVEGFGGDIELRSNDANGGAIARFTVPVAGPEQAQS